MTGYPACPDTWPYIVLSIAFALAQDVNKYAIRITDKVMILV